jgi:hypothetical protein
MKVTMVAVVTTDEITMGMGMDEEQPELVWAGWRLQNVPRKLFTQGLLLNVEK